MHTLRQLVWDSIRVRRGFFAHRQLLISVLQFSGLDDDEKERAFRMLERRWAKFVAYVLDEHADSSNAP